MFSKLLLCGGGGGGGVVVVGWWWCRAYLPQKFFMCVKLSFEIFYPPKGTAKAVPERVHLTVFPFCI